MITLAIKFLCPLLTSFQITNLWLYILQKLWWDFVAFMVKLLNTDTMKMALEFTLYKGVLQGLSMNMSNFGIEFVR